MSANTSITNDQDMPRKKIIILGDECVGKSSIMSQFVNNSFQLVYVPTIAVDAKTKICDFKGTQTKLCIYDTSGKARFNTIVEAYISKADRILIVYDKTDLRSFHNVKRWLDMVKTRIRNPGPILLIDKYDPGTKIDTLDHNLDIILVGNKSDLADKIEVSTDMGQQFASDHNMDFVEVSALDNMGIDEIFGVSTIDVKEPELCAVHAR